MGYDAFQTNRTVKSRKAHRCAHCRSFIPTGTPHIYTVGKFHGDFYAERAHEDCRVLWSALFSDWGDPYDGMAYDLIDLFTDSGDKDAVSEALGENRGYFPHAVCRIEYRLRHWLGSTPESEQ